MAEAYHVGKRELLDWLAESFNIHYDKVEQCASGAAHCQIVDAVFRDVSMSKVNFEARFDWEFVQNYKVLQAAFSKHGVVKHVDVERLIKGKYQDNLEFLQWMKSFFDSHYNGQAYDADARRAKSKGGSAVGAPAGGAKRPAARRPAAAGRVAHSVVGAAAPAAAVQRPARSAAQPARRVAVTAASAAPVQAKRRSLNAQPVAAVAAASAAPVRTSSGVSTDTLQKLQARLAEVEAELSSAHSEIDELETERNFYFEKLRLVEVLCRDEQSLAVTLGLTEAAKKHILDILYQVDENENFKSQEVDVAPGQSLAAPTPRKPRALSRVLVEEAISVPDQNNAAEQVEKDFEVQRLPDSLLTAGFDDDDDLLGGPVQAGAFLDQDDDLIAGLDNIGGAEDDESLL